MTMNEDYVQKTRRESELDLIKIYMEKLQEESLNLNGRARTALINRLESLFYVIEQSAFDPKTALRIRKEKELTLKELAKKLGSTKQHINHYESGKLPLIQGIREGKFPHAYNYLNWLNEEGNYDPFNLTNKKAK
jgi:DNA-binding transcriptional regulator YiaG